ncbi:MAG: hypothetical protein CMC93_05285 [Flavobacteriaceae bacterium]|nr:hypothetical protein [Flavobacteriaceae bacterium]
MKNIKDITISIFAIIGFVAIITAFTNQPEQANQTIYSTPDSHVWQSDISDQGRFYLYNKVTGEVRKYAQKTHGKEGYNHYVITKEVNY